MLNDNAKKWVAALRSGEYRQGRHRLHNRIEDTWCCLGVACSLAVREGVIDWPAVKENCDVFDGQDNCLPGKVMLWLNLRSPGGSFGERDTQSLWWMNDNDKLTFAEIADIIESESGRLFVAQPEVPRG